MRTRSRVVLRSLAAVGFLAVGMNLGAGARAGVFNPESFTLANGLQVVVVYNARVPVVSHTVMYKIGSADEPPGKSGIAHFLEHLMFKGTKTRMPGDFSRQVAREGGQENAFTSLDYTGYFQNVAADRLELVMRLEADRMANLVLTDEVVLPERDVILEERRSRVENSPASLLREHAMAALFLNHPYRIPIIGWMHEMERLTAKDAVEFYDRYYAPNNAVLIVTGDATVARVRELAEKYYGPIPPKAIPARVRPSEPPHRAPRRVQLASSEVANPSLTRYYLAPGYGGAGREHAYALQVLSEILGSGPTSRLYRALVEGQSLASSAGSFYDPASLGPGTFGLYASPRQGQTVADAEAALDRQIGILLADGVGEAEVERAKNRMVTSAIFARDSLRGPAQTLGAALAAGRTIADVEEWPDRIGRVTREQVEAAARAVFKIENSVTSLLLPKPTS